MAGEGPIRWRGKLRGRKRDEDDPGEGTAEFWQQPEAGRTCSCGPPIGKPGASDGLGERRRRRLVVRPGERVARPAPLSDYAFVRIEVMREDVIAVLQRAAQQAEAESAEDEPATHAPLKNLGGSPGKWDWSDLAARLPNTVKNNPFEDKAAFEEWCTNNVRRIDGELATSGSRPTHCAVRHQQAPARSNPRSLQAAVTCDNRLLQVVAGLLPVFFLLPPRLSLAYRCALLGLRAERPTNAQLD